MEDYEFNRSRKDPARVAAGKKSIRTATFRAVFEDILELHRSRHPYRKQSTLRYQVIDYLERFCGREDPESAMSVEELKAARTIALRTSVDITRLPEDKSDLLEEHRPVPELSPRPARAVKPAPEPEVVIQWADEDEPGSDATPRRLRP